MRRPCLERTRLHCSVGIGNNKLQAKIATDFGKPPHSRLGIYAITDETWYDEMGARPTRALWGVGAKIAGRLAAHGIETVTDLATSDIDALVGEFGPTMGPWFHRLGRGVDTSPVDATPWVARAHGREETYQRDLEWHEVPDAVRELAARVVAGHRRRGPAGHAGAPQDPLPQLLHPHPLAQAPGAQQRPERRSATSPSRCSRRSSRTNPSGCSGCGSRWCRRRVATSAEHRFVCRLSEKASHRRRIGWSGQHVEPRRCAVVRRAALPMSATRRSHGGAGGGDDLGRVAERAPGARRTRPRRRPRPGRRARGRRRGRGRRP